MPTRDNRTTIDEPLRVGLIADSEQLPGVAAALRRPSIQIVAQGGMKQTEALPEIPWHDDIRVLVAQAEIDAIALAASTRINREMTRYALARGIHVWRTAPLARSFAQAIEDAKLAQAANVVHRVQSHWRHIYDDVSWALGLTPAFRPQYGELRIAAPGPPAQSWRSSETDSAGGVLAIAGFGLLEAWLATRGLPENVLARIGSCRRRAGEPSRETEDVALVMMREENGGLGLIRAMWDIEPYESELALHGADASVLISANAVRVRLVNQTQLDARPTPSFEDRMQSEFAQFEAAVRRRMGGDVAAGGDPQLSLQLAGSALLEAIYLSARTNQPESPRKLYEVQGWPLPE